MTSPLVSVVIPTHNRRLRLARTLGTALHQPGVALEVIVVDDGSTDGTADYVADHPDRRVRGLRHDRAEGVAAARNTGIEAARGQWIAFLDDDDLWAPAKLGSQLQALGAVKGAGWSAVGSVNVDDSLAITGWARPPASGELRGRFRARNVIPGGGSGVVVSASLMRSIGRFDTRFSFVEDLDLWIRLADRAPIASVDHPLLGYVVHGSNLTSTGRGYEAELVAVEARHGRLGERRVSTLALRASNAVAEGRWLDAARMTVRAAAIDRDPRSAMQTAAIAVGRLLRRPARTAPAMMPPAWRAEAEAWLAGVPPLESSP